MRHKMVALKLVHVRFSLQKKHSSSQGRKSNINIYFLFRISRGLFLTLTPGCLGVNMFVAITGAMPQKGSPQKPRFGKKNSLPLPGPRQASPRQALTSVRNQKISPQRKFLGRTSHGGVHSRGSPGPKLRSGRQNLGKSSISARASSFGQKSFGLNFRSLIRATCLVIKGLLASSEVI